MFEKLKNMFKKEEVKPMSKLLVVKAHPLTAEVSASLTGLDAFVAAYKAANPADEIEMLDLFATEVPELDTDVVGAFYALQGGTEFSALSAEQQRKLGLYNGFTDQFLAADKVVIASPLYNLGTPAALKRWVDTLMVAGKTFKYTAEGPKGLVEGKKVLHLQANGGVYEGKDPSTVFMSTALGFIGTDYTQIAVEGHAYAPEKAEEIKAAFVAKVEEAAKTF
jgi:FMN-dependent NADH-azoreductase